MSPSFRPGIQLILLRNMPSSSLLIPTGLSPSMALLSRKFWYIKKGGKGSPTTPHVYCITTEDSVCPEPFSLAVTHGISSISFPAGTKTLQFPALDILSDFLKEGSPIQESSVQRLRAPRRSLSQLVTLFISIPSQVIHLMG
jgi:hypothetical protein